MESAGIKPDEIGIDEGYDSSNKHVKKKIKSRNSEVNYSKNGNYTADGKRITNTIRENESDLNEITYDGRI